MEVLAVRCAQTSVGKIEFPERKIGFCNSKQICPKPRRIGFDLTRKLKRESVRFALKAIRSEISRTATVADEKAIGRKSREKSEDGLRLFVGLPLDCHTLQNAKAIGVGLKALKLLGVEGVELPVWWGVAEKEGPCNYDWSSYLSLAKMVQETGLKLHVSIGFHATEKPTVALPQWVSRIGKTHPDIFFTDRSGRRYKKCLSLAVDDLPVLEGTSPMQVYERFIESFKSSFSDFIGSTITDISVSLGPSGELRYPSFPLESNGSISAVGEFQCYDKHMLANVKQHAETAGQCNWGLSGPHDGPQYKDSLNNSFIREAGGSWETPYGDFFLSWYSNQLLSHGDRLLSLASTAFGDSRVTLSGKIPLMHSWYKTRSHPSELTAGFYNTANRDGYNAVAEIFAKNSCKMIIPGMDLSDECQPAGSQSSPESLLSQITSACKRHGVLVSGENSLVSSSTSSSLSKIKNRMLSSEDPLASFTYQRMGAYFFSPEHWPLFSEFVRSLDGIELSVDDLPLVEKKTIPSLSASSEQPTDRQMQAV